MTFELQGGIMAYDQLHRGAPNLTAVQVGDIVQSIVLHTSTWSSGNSSATGALMFLSAFFDIFGYDSPLGPFDALISRTTVQEVEKVYPRREFGPEARETLENQFDEKPNCLISHLAGGRDVLLKIRDAPIGDE
ncbi:hypothetical protein C8R43DRAFT_968468 [Mycena crocata]|nr:hypothetical protein C8R43DRAFT_968468 [Mycena crocata]